MRPLHAQGLDQRLADEVNAIRAEVARSNLALRGYTWTEHTEVLVKGKLQSASDAACRYDATGQIVKARKASSGCSPCSIVYTDRTKFSADAKSW